MFIKIYLLSDGTGVLDLSEIISEKRIDYELELSSTFRKKSINECDLGAAIIMVSKVILNLCQITTVLNLR